MKTLATGLLVLAACGPKITAVTPLGIRLAGADLHPDPRFVDYVYGQVLDHAQTARSFEVRALLDRADEITVEWAHDDHPSFNDGRGYVRISVDFCDGSDLRLPLSYCVLAHELTHQVASFLGTDTTDHPGPWFWVEGAVQLLAQEDVASNVDLAYRVETLPATELCFQ